MWVLRSVTCNLPKIVWDCHLRVLNYTSTLTFSMRTTGAHVKLLGIEWCSFHSKLLTSTFFTKGKWSLADVISGVSKIHPCSIFSNQPRWQFSKPTPTLGPTFWAHRKHRQPEKVEKTLGLPDRGPSPRGGLGWSNGGLTLEDIPNIRNISSFGRFSYDLRLAVNLMITLLKLNIAPCFKGDASHKPITFLVSISEVQVLCV